MTKKIFWWLFLLMLFWSSVPTFAQTTKCTTNDFWICSCPDWFKKSWDDCLKCDWDKVCCGVKLNTDIPFIWNCIALKSQDSDSKITEENAFPTLMAWFTKLLMTVILIVCFLVIIVAWVLWTTWDSKKWKDMIKWVAIALALLWASGVILRLVNPNFFG